MATWDDVRRIALSLPETTEDDGGTWRVRGKSFVWKRPLRKADFAALGADAPAGDILGARVSHVDQKDELIAADPSVYFTTPHFDGYPAILVILDAISVDELTELATDAWLVQAPKRLAASFLVDRE
jgi:hypothetical protein